MGREELQTQVRITIRLLRSYNAKLNGAASAADLDTRLWAQLRTMADVVSANAQEKRLL